MPKNHDIRYSTVLRHQPRTSLKPGFNDSALCRSWTCDSIPLHSQVAHFPVANRLERTDYPAALSRKSSCIFQSLYAKSAAKGTEMTARSSSPALSVSFTDAVLRYGFFSGLSVFALYLPSPHFGSFSFHFRCLYFSNFITITRSEVCKL
jgi:hypothetical protein